MTLAFMEHISKVIMDTTKYSKEYGLEIYISFNLYRQSIHVITLPNLQMNLNKCAVKHVRKIYRIYLK